MGLPSTVIQVEVSSAFFIFLFDERRLSFDANNDNWLAIS